MSQWQATADTGLDFSDRQLVMGPTEGIVRVDLRGVVRAGALWSDVRTGAFQDLPTPVGGQLAVRALNPLDQGGGPGAQRVLAVGWRLINGVVRPWQETLVLNGPLTKGATEWLWVVGATALCGALKAVASEVDVMIIPQIGDGCVRIEPGFSVANRPSVLLPPSYVAFVDQMGVTTDPPGGAAGVRLLVQTFDDTSTAIDLPAVVPDGIQTKIVGNLVGVAPQRRPWIRLQAYGVVNHDVYVWAKLTVARLTSAATQIGYRSWLGPAEVP